MKSPSRAATGKRPYRQRARARAAAQTAEAIVEAFEARIASDRFEQITLEQVAGDAGVTVQTVLRRFGGKDGLLHAAWNRIDGMIERNRRATPCDPEAVVRIVTTDYEAVGDLIAELLAQESRVPELKAGNDQGRAKHRAWLEAAFAEMLAGLPPAQRRRRVDALVTVTDLYVWKLVRRDMGRSLAHTRKVMLDLILGVLSNPGWSPAGDDRDV